MLATVDVENMLATVGVENMLATVGVEREYDAWGGSDYALLNTNVMLILSLIRNCAAVNRTGYRACSGTLTQCSELQ